MTTWISVEERLPTESGWYLCADTRGDVDILFCSVVPYPLFHPDNVTHWMPLPPHPDAETK